MKVLIAEDDPLSRRVLEAVLVKAGYEVIACVNGAEAWQALQGQEAPSLAILDWMMPGMDGIEICRKVREAPEPHLIYLILLTARGRGEDLVAGLRAGADDYITKPFERGELLARLQVGRRLVELQQHLTERAREKARFDLLAQLTVALTHHISNALTPLLGMAQTCDPERPLHGQMLKEFALSQGARIEAIVKALVEMVETRDLSTVPYLSQGEGTMLDLEPLIQRYLKQGS
jgi:CheY-like chemotaxis protein